MSDDLYVAEIVSGEAQYKPSERELFLERRLSECGLELGKAQIKLDKGLGKTDIVLVRSSSQINKTILAYKRVLASLVGSNVNRDVRQGLMDPTILDEDIEIRIDDMVWTYSYVAEMDRLTHRPTGKVGYEVFYKDSAKELGGGLAKYIEGDFNTLVDYLFKKLELKEKVQD